MWTKETVSYKVVCGLLSGMHGHGLPETPVLGGCELVGCLSPRTPGREQTWQEGSSSAEHL